MSNQSEISSNTSVVTMNVNGYLIKANTDSDGHLTLTIDHDDGTAVVDVGCDIADSDTQWAARFSTDGLERSYSESLSD